jgi:steroid delta-isomerase-like uncharacterized protein
MSAETRKALERRLIEEVWNRGNLDFAERCFTTDYVNHDPSSPEEIRGPEGFKQNVAAIREAFPDFRMEIVDQVAEGEKVVTRYVITGTQEGELAGIPPSGRRIEVDGMGIDYFRGGKICESWEYYDVMGLMQQLGAIPYPEEQPV